MTLGIKERRNRPRVSNEKVELLFHLQNGKCAGCHKSFKRMKGVKPMVHHIGKSNRISDLQLLCPNCHYSEEAHQWVTKRDPWTGEKYPRLVKKRLGKSRKIHSRNSDCLYN